MSQRLRKMISIAMVASILTVLLAACGGDATPVPGTATTGGGATGEATATTGGGTTDATATTGRRCRRDLDYGRHRGRWPSATLDVLGGRDQLLEPLHRPRRPVHADHR
jgi:hypothetical protein